VAWDNLAQRLEEESKRGFSGTVLVVRGGKIILHRGYGLAERERGLPNTTETIFAIGSVPIEFTKAAVLKLEEMGKLRTSDAITMYFADVPADKQAVTIDHLMSGASGLPDFHHVAGVDADPDLAWIDRETAIRRILGQELLFSPGGGQAHSHSAWVLLAALVEVVSKQSYGDFLRAHFFAPAGMTRTGLHEDLERFPDDELAVGYGGQSAGRINSPKHWGPTSWLVVGSGGMASTPHDLHAWLDAMRRGKLLTPAAEAKYWSHGLLAGGDDRGFLCLFTQGPDDLMILCSNAHAAPGDLVSALGRRLAELVMGRPLPGPGKVETSR
jgi:CubicO group peptidase (beta-lactamase class C family)